ncbi:unnamed protein product [Cunninghamella blakesleeana]
MTIDTVDTSEENKQTNTENISNQLIQLMDFLLQKSSDTENNNNDSNKNINNIEIITQLDLWIKFLFTIQKANQLDILSTIDYTQLTTTLKMLEQMLYKLTEIELSDYLKEIKKNIKHDDTTLLIKTEDQVVSAISIIHKTLRLINKIYAIYAVDHAKEKLFSEELFLTSLQFVKNQLDNIIYPLIDLNNFEGSIVDLAGSTYELNIIANSNPKAKQLLSDLLPLISQIVQKSILLLQEDNKEDHTLIVLAYISVGPFFHEYIPHINNITKKNMNSNSCSVVKPINSVYENTTTSSTTIDLGTIEVSSVVNTYEYFKYICLNILQTLFQRYPKHRHWILEEILNNLDSFTVIDYRQNKQFRLRNGGKSIHSLSALFMQLIQSCCCYANDTLQLQRTWQKKWDLKTQKLSSSPSDLSKMDDHQKSLSNHALNEWKKGIEMGIQHATYFLEFIMSKCKSKKKNTYSVLEYRTILDCTIEDILLVLNDADWPVAELIIQVFTKILIGCIDSEKGDLYIRTIAIEWLGTIACRIKVGYNRVSGNQGSYTPEWIYQLNKLIPMESVKQDMISHQILDQCRMKFYQYMLDKSTNKIALQFYLSSWGYITSTEWKKLQETEKEKKEDATEIPSKDLESKNDSVSVELNSMLQSLCHRYWLLDLNLDCTIPNDSKFEFPELNYDDIQLLVELLATRQNLFSGFKVLLSKILSCLDKSVTTFRVKALRAIGQIATDTPEILNESHIRNIVIQHVYDVSPTVRDASIEVLAKYLIQQKTIPRKLYDIISVRILDTAPNVRKRLVKVLPDLYHKCDDQDIKIDIAAKLLQRTADNEITIQSLALKVSQQVLFYHFHEIDQDENYFPGYSFDNASKHRKEKVNGWTDTIIKTISKLDGTESSKNTILLEFIQKTKEKANEKQWIWYEKTFQWIVDSLFEKILELDESDNTEEFINCMSIIQAFTKVCPALLSETQVYTLLPYLSTESDEWVTSQYVMKLYFDALPRIRYSDVEFSKMVENVLLQLLSKCPLHILSDAVSCLCVIVEKISHRYPLLIKILGSCLQSIEQDKKNINANIQIQKPVRTCKALMISGLLCQYFDFDEKRLLEPSKMQDLDKIYKGNITSHMFNTLLYFVRDNDSVTLQIKLASLKALGCLYNSHPKYIILSPSVELLDSIFEKDNTDMKTQLMVVFKKFLDSEELRIQKKAEDAGETLKQKVIDVETLMGNTEEFAELGVNGSLIQRYLPSVLKCALGTTNQLRLTAFDVIETVINQGLAHPIMCMPAIVAAETSSQLVLRNKAYYLHTYIHDKFGSIIYSHISEYIMASFEYQKLMCGSDIKGYGKRIDESQDDALLGITYSVLKQKERSKIDFLIALTKPFAIDIKRLKQKKKNMEVDSVLNSTTTTTGGVVDIDLTYFTYLADNILTLPFSDSEEVLAILYSLNRTFITTGTDLLSFVQQLKDENILSIQSYLDEDDDMNEDDLNEDLILASKISIIMTVALYAKKKLMNLYHIDETELQEFDINEKGKTRAITKDFEVNQYVDWKNEITYFKLNKFDLFTASEACINFDKVMYEDNIV